METLPDSLQEQRALLLAQLSTVQLRKDELRQELGKLVNEELAFSRYVLQAQRKEDPKVLRLAVTEALVKFHHHAGEILTTLKEAQGETDRILKALQSLRTHVPF